MAHIQHHHSSSIRYLLRGSNPVLAAMQLKDMLWVSLRLMPSGWHDEHDTQPVRPIGARAV